MPLCFPNPGVNALDHRETALWTSGALGQELLPTLSPQPNEPHHYLMSVGKGLWGILP